MNVQVKATEIKDNDKTFRVYIVAGVAELYIDIDKATGSSPDASVKPNAMVWGKMYRAAAAAITKHYPGQYPAIRA